MFLLSAQERAYAFGQDARLAGPRPATTNRTLVVALESRSAAVSLDSCNFMALASYVVHPSSVAIALKTIRTRGGVFFAVSAIADTCVAQGIAILVFCERNASRVGSTPPVWNSEILFRPPPFFFWPCCTAIY